MTSEDIIEILARLEPTGFKRDQIRKITYIAEYLNAAGMLEGNFSSISTGGGCYHIFFQLTNNTWVWFHSDSNDITVSDPFKTSRKVHDAFWSNWKAVTNRWPAGAGQLDMYKKAAESIKAGNFEVGKEQQLHTKNKPAN